MVSKNSVEGCSASPGFADGIGIYVLGDDARVSDNYAVVMNDTAGAGAYVAGLALNAARCLATGNNVNGIGSGGATPCGILFGLASVGSCVAVGNHMNGKGLHGSRGRELLRGDAWECAVMLGAQHLAVVQVRAHWCVVERPRRGDGMQRQDADLVHQKISGAGKRGPTPF